MKGKVVVMLNNDPDWDPKLFAGTTRLYYGRWAYKYESAARHGAAGVIIVHTTPSAGYPWQVVTSSWSGEQFGLPAEGEPRVQFTRLGHRSRRAPAREGGRAGSGQAHRRRAQNRNFKPVPLALKTTFKFENKVSRVKTANVGGAAAGQRCEAEERGGRSSPRTTITSASGRRTRRATRSTTARKTTLPVARRCSRLRVRWQRCRSGRRRSVLVLFVAAEEQGLLGSQYYSLHPTFAPGQDRGQHQL